MFFLNISIIIIFSTIYSSIIKIKIYHFIVGEYVNNKLNDVSY